MFSVGAVFAKVAMKEYNFNKRRAIKTINEGLLYSPNNRDLKKNEGLYAVSSEELL